MDQTTHEGGLAQLIDSLAIEPADATWYARAQARWDAIAKPIGSLGCFEDAVSRICALERTLEPTLERPHVAVLCADHGVAARGVTGSDPSVTRLVAGNVADGVSSVSLLASAAGVGVDVFDLGMSRPLAHERVRDMRVRAGTADFTQGPALTRDQATRAVIYGVEIATGLVGEGCDLICLGEVGIANTTAATALTCALTGAAVTEICGRGAGLTDEGLARKRAAITQALATNARALGDPAGALAAVGGLELAGMAGVVLGAASLRVPVVVDGMVAMAAALAAVRLVDAARDALVASHRSAEPAAGVLAQALGLRPPIDAEMRVGEGTGAVMVVPLLRMVLALFQGGATYESSGIDAVKE